MTFRIRNSATFTNVPETQFSDLEVGTMFSYASSQGLSRRSEIGFNDNVYMKTDEGYKIVHLNTGNVFTIAGNPVVVRRATVRLEKGTA